MLIYLEESYDSDFPVNTCRLFCYEIIFMKKYMSKFIGCII